MEKVRSIAEEVIDIINHEKKMTSVLNQLEELSRKELDSLNDILSILTTKTKDEYVSGRLLMLKNQITMVIIKNIGGDNMYLLNNIEMSGNTINEEETKMEKEIREMKEQVQNFSNIYEELRLLKERNKPVVVNDVVYTWDQLDSIFMELSMEDIEMIANLDEHKVTREIKLYAQYFTEADEAQANELALMAHFTKDMYI